MDDTLAKVLQQIGSMAEEHKAKALKMKYGAGGEKAKPKAPTQGEYDAQHTPGGRPLEYEKMDDGSLVVKWENGATTEVPPEEAEAMTRQVDMSTYGRTVNSRREAGVPNPMDVDPMDVGGTPENKALHDAEGSAERLGMKPHEGAAVRAGAKRLDEDRFQAKAAGKPQPSLSVQFTSDDEGPDSALALGGNDDEDEVALLSRAGKRK